MNIREDFNSVTAFISRLTLYGETFDRFDRDWSHLKNREDFGKIYHLDEDHKIIFERLYADGRDMALFMSEALIEINNNISKYPTLTSIVKSFEKTWVYSKTIEDIKNKAEENVAALKINWFSISEMIKLYKTQVELLRNIRGTLNILKQTDLYKMENGEFLMKKSETSIFINSVDNSNLNIQSTVNSHNTNIKNDTKLFQDIIDAVSKAKIEASEQEKLISHVLELEKSKTPQEFSEKYKKLIEIASNHISILAPFIPALTTFL